MVVGYGVVVALLLLAGAVARYAARSGRGVDSDREPTAEEVAIALDDRTRAVYASVAGQCVAGAFTARPDRTVVADGSGPIGSTLDRAVHDAVKRGVPVKDLTTELSAALDEVQAAVSRAGWLLTDRERRAATVGKWPMLVAAAGGVALAVLRDEPVGVALPVLVAVAVLAGLGFRREPRLSRSGVRAVDRARRRYPHLRPDLRPSFRTYGPEASKMAVALFGVSVLWQIDLMLAMSLGAGRHASTRREPRRFSASGSTGNCGGGCGDCGGGCGE